MVMSFLDLDNEKERFVEVFVDAREEVDALDNHILIRFEDTFILIGPEKSQLISAPSKRGCRKFSLVP